MLLDLILISLVVLLTITGSSFFWYVRGISKGYNTAALEFESLVSKYRKAQQDTISDDYPMYAKSNKLNN
jgi:hypothetical protein